MFLNFYLMFSGDKTNLDMTLFFILESKPAINRVILLSFPVNVSYTINILQINTMGHRVTCITAVIYRKCSDNSYVTTAHSARQGTKMSDEQLSQVCVGHLGD